MGVIEGVRHVGQGLCPCLFKRRYLIRQGQSPCPTFVWVWLTMVCSLFWSVREVTALFRAETSASSADFSAFFATCPASVVRTNNGGGLCLVLMPMYTSSLKVTGLLTGADIRLVKSVETYSSLNNNTLTMSLNPARLVPLPFGVMNR